MKDVFDLLGKVFGSSPTPKKKVIKASGLDRHPTGPIPFPDKNIEGAIALKKKERLAEVEREVQDLKETVQRQAELLKRLTQSLGELSRDVAPLLPEK